MRAFDASTSLGCPKGTMLCACTGGGGGGVACLSVDHNRVVAESIKTKL